MKLGLMTAAFPRLTLDQIAAWSAENGFETLEIACWPSSGGQRRRYAGVCHIDVHRFDVGLVRETLTSNGLEISSLAYYPNPLHPDPVQRRQVQSQKRSELPSARRSSCARRRAA